MPFPPIASPAVAGPGLTMPVALPLQGLTILAVEDSRFALEALRLICQRAGARLRRADDLLTARLHLRCYRPDVVLVDLSLPDGGGEELICELAARRPHGPLILAMSGDPARRSAALTAGAMGFIAKPLAAAEVLLRVIQPAGAAPADPGLQPSVGADLAEADGLALRDDLIRAQRALVADASAQQREWLAGFLAGLAGQAADPELAALADRLRRGPGGFVPVAALLRDRIARAGQVVPKRVGRG